LLYDKVAATTQVAMFCINKDAGASYESAPLPVSLVHTGQAPPPLKLRAFLDFVGPRLRARMSRLLGETAPV
jgi:hypothetical protein